jgi:hypothetical protein
LSRNDDLATGEAGAGWRRVAVGEALLVAMGRSYGELPANQAEQV